MEPLEVFFERIKARRRAENNVPGTIYNTENAIRRTIYLEQYTVQKTIYMDLYTIQATIYWGAAGYRRQLASTILVNIENNSQ